MKRRQFITLPSAAPQPPGPSPPRGPAAGVRKLPREEIVGRGTWEVMSSRYGDFERRGWGWLRGGNAIEGIVGGRQRAGGKIICVEQPRSSPPGPAAIGVAVDRWG